MFDGFPLPINYIGWGGDDTINAGAGDGVLDGMAAQHRAVGVVEAAAHRFGEAGAGRGDDDSIFHGVAS